jgi:hypothetical protein
MRDIAEKVGVAVGGIIIYDYFYSPIWFIPAFILIFVLILLIFIFGHPAAESKE